MSHLHKHIIGFVTALTAAGLSFLEMITPILQIILILVGIGVGIKTLLLRHIETKNKVLDRHLKELELEGILEDVSNKERKRIKAKIRKKEDNV